MNKLYIENALSRSNRARLMLAFRYRVPRIFRWIGFGKYKFDPRLIGIMEGWILVGSCPRAEADSLVTSLEESGLNTITETSLVRIFGDTFRNFRDYASAFFTILMCLALQYFVWYFWPDSSTLLLKLSLVIASLAIFIVVIPKFCQRPNTVEEVRVGIGLIKGYETNTHAARNHNSVAAIFPSNAFRDLKVSLLLLICLSWIVAPFFYYVYSDFTSFVLYLSMTPLAIFALSLNRRILNHEISWVLNAEHLLMYSNIWFGPRLKISSKKVVGLVKEGTRLRIKFSSREDFSLFINMPEETLVEVVEWTNQLLAENFSRITPNNKPRVTGK